MTRTLRQAFVALGQLFCERYTSDGFEPEEALRSIWFDNADVAALKMPEGNPCLNCSAPCEEACISKFKVPVKELMTES